MMLPFLRAFYQKSNIGSFHQAPRLVTEVVEGNRSVSYTVAHVPNSHWQLMTVEVGIGLFFRDLDL